MEETKGARLAVPVHAGDHVRGRQDAPVTLVEYGDFECWDTSKVLPAVKELLRRFDGSVKLVYRHFPITHKHPRAQWAAEAAEAAGAQGRFWEMHDELFVHQNLLGDEHLGLYVARVGLDEQRLRRELDSHVHAERVRTDLESGERSGVMGTPTFFIDDVRYEGGWDATELGEAIEAALRGKRGS